MARPYMTNADLRPGDLVEILDDFYSPRKRDLFLITGVSAATGHPRRVCVEWVNLTQQKVGEFAYLAGPMRVRFHKTNTLDGRTTVYRDGKLISIDGWGECDQ